MRNNKISILQHHELERPHLSKQRTTIIKVSRHRRSTDVTVTKTLLTTLHLLTRIVSLQGLREQHLFAVHVPADWVQVLPLLY
ncbi:unnamed protein product, partial [Amoebophrya sp. A25]|eukprot:GSA25T00024105001.1